MLKRSGRKSLSIVIINQDRSLFFCIFRMDDFINEIKRGPKVRTKLIDMLDRYNRLPLKYQSKNKIRFFDSE